jgi:hypothetical protein
MNPPEFKSFDEFWPFYVREHANDTNRALHFVGTTLALGSVAAGLLTGRRAFFVAAPVFGYGFAWVGHFVVQRNKPATFTYPAWSLQGDMLMWWKTLNGEMAAEVERVTRDDGVHQVRVDVTVPAAERPN